MHGAALVPHDGIDFYEPTDTDTNTVTGVGMQ